MRKYIFLFCGKRVKYSCKKGTEKDPCNVITTGFVINGAKTFCSNGPVGDLILVYALTDESKGYYGGITAFIVDKNAKGFKIGQKYEKMGLRTSGISEVIFENVFVSEEDIVGGLGGGATVFNHSMEWERTGIAACHVGTMRKLLERSIEYVQTRKSGNEVIGKNKPSHIVSQI